MITWEDTTWCNWYNPLKIWHKVGRSSKISKRKLFQHLLRGMAAAKAAKSTQPVSWTSGISAATNLEPLNLLKSHNFNKPKKNNDQEPHINTRLLRLQPPSANMMPNSWEKKTYLDSWIVLGPLWFSDGRHVVAIVRRAWAVRVIPNHTLPNIQKFKNPSAHVESNCSLYPAWMTQAIHRCTFSAGPCW